jgi:hypothetical protein
VTTTVADRPAPATGTLGGAALDRLLREITRPAPVLPPGWTAPRALTFGVRAYMPQGGCGCPMCDRARPELPLSPAAAAALAAELAAGGRHLKNQLLAPPGDPGGLGFCIVGALWAAQGCPSRAGGDWVDVLGATLTRVEDLIWARWPQRVQGAVAGEVAIEWNNHPATTKEEVITVLIEAAAG